MDILIEIATSKEVNRWGGMAVKVLIPGTNDVVFPGDDSRPMDIGSNHFLATPTVVEPALGVDQKRGPETMDVDDKVVTLIRPAVDMTAQEISDRDKANDEGELRQGGLKMAHVLVELVTKLLANGTISGADFTPETKQMYQDIKAIADRLNS